MLNVLKNVIGPAAGHAHDREKTRTPRRQDSRSHLPFIFIIVLLLAVLVPEHLFVVGWIVVPMIIMGIALAGFESKKNE